VLPIGGLKEKAVAAHRHRVALVVVPRGNARSLDELPDGVRAEVAWHPVATMDEVLRLALRPPAVPEPHEHASIIAPRRSRARTPRAAAARDVTRTETA
jgi:ATP-dependent Lon protease